jgi:fructosamine-3-kinase
MRPARLPPSESSARTRQPQTVDVTNPRGNPAATAQHEGFWSELRTLALDHGVASIRRLPGGYVADVWLVTYADGTRVVGKTLTGAPADLFHAEAEGLRALRATGHLQAPQVLAVTDRLLLLEALAARDDSESSWEAFAHDLAALHGSTVHEMFGWARDGYLGRVVQQNPWTASGHEFFVQHRVLRYLDEPLVQQELTSADRRALEHFCDRLTEFIPVMPAVLTHGDLWSGNLLSRDDGRITAIDPAVSYTWAEVDLSMLWGCQRPPSSERFFDVYQELNPSLPGWRDRMPLLHVRELLSSMAHIGNAEGGTQRLRGILAPFYRR